MWGPSYDLLLRPLERLGLRARRRELLARARGRALEIGAGTGLNFDVYPPGVELVALEPDASMRKRARRRAAGRPIGVVAGDAGALPFPDASFDTVVFTLVFCTVPDVDAALREAARVLAPAGRVLLLEHVRPEGALGGLADRLTPPWRLVSGGCRLNGRPEASFKKAGLEPLEERRLWRGAGRAWILRKAGAML